jgi:hypothetical protein
MAKRNAPSLARDQSRMLADIFMTYFPSKHLLLRYIGSSLTTPKNKNICGYCIIFGDFSPNKIRIQYRMAVLVFELNNVCLDTAILAILPL